MYSPPAPKPKPPARLKTGIEGFDSIIEGGFLPERVYLVCGPPGAGKTTFAVHFLTEGCKKGEIGLYVSLIESPINIVKDMARYRNMQVPQFVRDKKLHFLDVGATICQYTTEPPTSAQIFDAIKKRVDSLKVRRLVIDGIDAIKFSSADEVQKTKQVSMFIRGLEGLGCTTLLIGNLTEPDRYTIEQFLAHGVIFLHNFLHGGQMTRAIQVVKMRGTKHDCNMRKITFTDAGIKVFSTEFTPPG